MAVDMSVLVLNKDGKEVSGNWSEEDEPFYNRNYQVYGFLADVRNYSSITPAPYTLVNVPHPDKDYNDPYTHCVLVEDLLAIDYDQIVEDRRVVEGTDPYTIRVGATCEAGKGVNKPLRELLGSSYMHDLEQLKNIGAHRVLMKFSY